MTGFPWRCTQSAAKNAIPQLFHWLIYQPSIAANGFMHSVCRTAAAEMLAWTCGEGSASFKEMSCGKSGCIHQLHRNGCHSRPPCTRSEYKNNTCSVALLETFWHNITDTQSPHWSRIGHLRCEEVAEQKCRNYCSGFYCCGAWQFFFEKCDAEIRNLPGGFKCEFGGGKPGAEEERKHTETQVARVERRKLC